MEIAEDGSYEDHRQPKEAASGQLARHRGATGGSDLLAYILPAETPEKVMCAVVKHSTLA
jgi:hypothetical protein